jgi:hypothetical protein
VNTTSGTYLWSFITHIFRSDEPSHGGDSKTIDVLTLAYPLGTLNSVAYVLAATLY